MTIKVFKAFAVSAAPAYAEENSVNEVSSDAAVSKEFSVGDELGAGDALMSARRPGRPGWGGFRFCRALGCR